jgi:hypothetical protein
MRVHVFQHVPFEGLLAHYGVGQRAYYATRFLAQSGYRAANLSGGHTTYRALRDAGLVA